MKIFFFFLLIFITMVLQAGLWAEMRVSVNIKQELPGRVGTHQLQTEMRVSVHTK
jgi:hypothetical protein